MKFLVLAVFLEIASGLTQANAANSPEWPLLQPASVSVGMDWGADKLYLDLPLFDRTGKVRYRLVCRGGSEQYLDSLEDRLHINYVGPLMCILNAGDQETEMSLLREGAVAPWFTRGQFAYRDIVGKCGAYPEFGSVRHFRLRGFELTIEIKDAEVIGQKVGNVIFKVSVRNDPSATSEIAEAVRYSDPRKAGYSCELNSAKSEKK